MTASLLSLMAFPARANRVVTEEQRQDAIARGKVWHPVDVEKMDLLNGPAGEGAYKFQQEVRCKYEEKDPLHPLGGHTKKFPCWENGTRLKIKYDPEDNLEVYSEVAGSRLFWALGFFAERLYSVKVVCENCPADPWISSSTPRATRTFEPATIQKKLQGEILTAADGDQPEAFTLDELDWADPARGGSTKAEVDGFRLLAALVNHGDNTPNQQRILCAADDKKCEHPLLYVTDLGSTFGGKDYLPSFKNWTRNPNVWKDPSRCVAAYEGTFAGSRDPKISEAGRALLAGLLQRLSDQQIRDLFKGARFDVLGKHQPPVAEPGGKAHPAGIDDWVRAFKKKRDQIVKAHCPS